MPRFISTQTNPLKLRDRAGHYKVTRLGVFIDPFPQIPGTLPEKMVYAALSARAIPFQFQEWLHVDIKELASNSWYRPDFMIPSSKIIIEVQGAYWHSKPERIVKDSLRAALFEMAGWKVLFWWDYDIYTRLYDLIASEPMINRPVIKGKPLPHTGKWYNDLAGLRAANAKRRKPWTKPAVRTKIRRRSKRAKSTYSRSKGAL